MREVEVNLTTECFESATSTRYLTTSSHSDELCWYAAYTSANHEKRVAEHLAARSIEYFLPLYQSVRSWKDRKVHLQLPLFPGYVFIRLALSSRVLALQVPGIAKLVGFNGTPSVLPQEEIELLQASFTGRAQAEPYPYLKVGRRVRVKAGPLAGFHGILVKRKSRTRLVVCMDLIKRAIAVEIDESEIEAN
jgi:transcription antitermination factor NusG